MKIKQHQNWIGLLSVTAVSFSYFPYKSFPYQQQEEQKVLAQDTSAKQQPAYITIKAVGDIVPGTNFPDNRLPDSPNLFFSRQIREKLIGADILFGNYESTLTRHPQSNKDTSRGMVFAFRSPPEYAKIFSQVGFDVMSVANNHSMDFGQVGFQDTIKNLESSGIVAVGKKNQIRYSQVKGVSVAWIAFCFYDYCNSVNNLETAKNLVEEAKQKAQIVVVSMHVGAEGKDALHVKNKTEFFHGENRGNSVLFARKMVDVGADLVLGHGPHVPRAKEIYKGKLIAYSLGNFLGYKTLSTQAEKGNSMILEAKLDREGNFISGNIIPVLLDRQGIPYLDGSFRTVKLVSSLIKSDFPQTKLQISDSGKMTLIQTLKKSHKLRI
jgi:poly-gamma-glutamate capsule biosynthesis protein CapA/YwtB (metallophosphatase superfamily)